MEQYDNTKAKFLLLMMQQNKSKGSRPTLGLQRPRTTRPITSYLAAKNSFYRKGKDSQAPSHCPAFSHLRFNYLTLNLEPALNPAFSEKRTYYRRKVGFVD